MNLCCNILAFHTFRLGVLCMTCNRPTVTPFFANAAVSEAHARLLPKFVSLLNSDVEPIRNQIVYSILRRSCRNQPMIALAMNYAVLV
eukprot:1215957-Pleurochrysis_carterae.AAC.1